MLADSGAAVAVTQRALADRVASAATVVLVEEVGLDGLPDTPPSSGTTPDNLIYMTRVQRQLAGRRKVNPAAGTDRGLSRRERQVAEMVARGLATKEIAAELFLSPRTVDAHVGQVLRKLDLTSRAGIAHRLTS